MAYDGCNPLGGLGTALGILLGEEMDFNIVNAFEMGLETGFGARELEWYRGSRGAERTN